MLFVEAAVVDGLDVPAAEREEVRRAVTFERLRDQPTAVDERHERKCTTRLGFVPRARARARRSMAPRTAAALGRGSFDRLVHVADEPRESRDEHFFGDAPPEVPLRVPPSHGSMRKP